MTPFNQARKDLGLSINELAEALDVSPRTVRRFCKGEYEPTRVFWLAIECLRTRRDEK